MENVREIQRCPAPCRSMAYTQELRSVLSVLEVRSACRCNAHRIYRRTFDNGTKKKLTLRSFYNVKLI